MGIVIEGVGFVAGEDLAVETVDSHIHQAQLGIVLHLFLAIEGHSRIGRHTRMVHEVTGLDKHTTTTTGGIQQDTTFGFQNIDDHLDQGFGCKEHAIVRCDVLGKFIEEVFVDPTQNISAHLIQCAIVEDTQQFRQDFIGEHGVVLGQDTNQLLTLLFDQFHSMVHSLADIGAFRQIHKVIIPGLGSQIQCALFRKVAGFHRHHSAPADRAILQNLSFHQLETAKSIAQENQAQNGHAILIRSQLGTLPQEVSRFP